VEIIRKEKDETNTRIAELQEIKRRQPALNERNEDEFLNLITI